MINASGLDVSFSSSVFLISAFSGFGSSVFGIFGVADFLGCRGTTVFSINFGFFNAPGAGGIDGFLRFISFSDTSGALEGP